MKKVVRIVPLWKRIVAYMFDCLLISVIIVTPLMPIGPENGFVGFLSFLMSTDFWIASIVIVFLTLVYWTFLEWKFGQSVGKILMRLKVVNERDKEINFFQALIRNLSKLSSIVLFLDVVYMLVGKGNQRFFERLSHTKVVGVVENE